MFVSDVCIPIAGISEAGRDLLLTQLALRLIDVLRLSACKIVHNRILSLLPKMRMHCRMSDMQPKVSIIWCQATVQAHAATLHHNSIQHTYNPESCTN